MTTIEKKKTISTDLLPFEKVPQLSARDIAYATENEALRPFYKYPVNLDSFAQVIADKQKKPVNRAVLIEVLEEQYANLSMTDAIKTNIKALADENTFTLITAHQPSLFTGPLYYIYKIISAINLAKTLNAHYTDYKFVPIFVTGGEDHDFEEVNHTHLFNNTLQWDSRETGSVGQMSTATLKPVLEELKGILGDSPNAQHLFKLIESTHTNHLEYRMAAIDLANELFKKDGLVVLGMSHPKLKRLFIPYIKEEIFEQPSQALVQETQEALTAAGFGGQAHSRAINFFYLSDQSRERIVLEDGRYQVLNTNFSFSKEELEQEIENHPERFSPNVIMRPLFQEVVMPNLAYIGGGGELAYWMERQSQFSHFGINFPMLIRRNSVLWIDKSNAKKMAKLDLSVSDIFRDTDELIKAFVKENTENELSLKKEKGMLKGIYDTVIEKAKEIDPTLVKTVKAEQAKQLNSLSAMEAKLLRAEKQRHDISINQIRGLKDKMFYNNGLQERRDNFMSLYLKYGETFFETLKDNLDVLDKRFVVVVDA